MPRQARLDRPGTLHHVILRGIERGAIVTDETDRAHLCTRLGLSMAEVARRLGVTTSAISRAVRRPGGE